MRKSSRIRKLLSWSASILFALSIAANFALQPAPALALEQCGPYNYPEFQADFYNHSTGAFLGSVNTDSFPDYDPTTKFTMTSLTVPYNTVIRIEIGSDAEPGSTGYVGYSGGHTFYRTNNPYYHPNGGSTMVIGGTILGTSMRVEATSGITADQSFSMNQVTNCSQNGEWWGGQGQLIVNLLTSAPPTPPSVWIACNGLQDSCTVPYNEEFEIEWDSEDTTSCTVSPDGWTGTSGVANPSLTSSRTYTLNCTGPGGSASDSVTVNVSAPTPSCSSMGPSPGAHIAYNSTSYYIYVYGVQNTTTVYIPVWTEANGQDDVFYYTATNQGGGTYRITVNIPYHQSFGSTYDTFHAAGYAGTGFEAYCGNTNFIVDPPPVCPAGSVTLGSSAIAVTTTTTASAPAGFSGGSFSSSNSSVASVSGSTLTGNEGGTANISGSGWTHTNGATNCSLSAAAVTVQDFTLSVSVSPSSVTKGGASATVTVTVNANPSGSIPVTVYAPSIVGLTFTPTIRSGYSGGAVTFDVSASASANTGAQSLNFIGYYNGSHSHSGSASLTVTPGVCPAGSVTLGAGTIDVIGSTTASAPAGFSGGTFSSSNSGVASVSGSTIYGVEGGTASISGSGWSNTNGATNCSLTGSTLTVRDFTLSLSGPSTAQKGTYITFTLTVNPNPSGSVPVNVYAPSIAGFSWTQTFRATSSGSTVTFDAFVDTNASTGTRNVNFLGYFSGSGHNHYSNTVNVNVTDSYSFNVAPSSLAFTATQGAALPGIQSFTITNTGTATLNFTVSKSASWLAMNGSGSNSTSVTVSPNGGTASVSFQPNTTSSSGTFSDTITFNSNSSAGSTTRGVSYTVNVGSCPSPAGAVILGSSAIDVTSSASVSAPAGYTGGSFYSNNTSVAGVSGSTVSGVEGGSASVYGLGWTYTPTGAANCSLTGSIVTVRDFTLSASASPTSVTKGGSAASITVTVSPNPGGTTVPVTVYPPSIAGFVFSPSVRYASSGGMVTFDVNATTSAPSGAQTLTFDGRYNGGAHGHTGGTGLTVNDSYGFSVTPASMTFSATQGGPLPAAQNFTITNTGTVSLTFTVRKGPGDNWLDMNGTTATTLTHIIAPNGGSVTVSIQPNSTSSAGTFSTAITFDSNSIAGTVTRNVTYTVNVGTCPVSGNTVSLGASAINVTTTTTVSAPAGFTGGTFSSSNSGVASVSGSTITGVHGGTANITGSGWTYSPNGATNCSLTGSTVIVRDFTLSPSVSPAAITQGGSPATVTLTVNPNPSGSVPVTVYAPSITGLTFTPTLRSTSSGSTVTFDVSASAAASTGSHTLTFDGRYNNGTHSHTAGTSLTVNAPPAPNQPTNVVASNSQCGQIVVTWQAPSGGTPPSGYRVHATASVDGSGNPTAWQTVYDGPSLTYTANPPLAPTGANYYRVLAYAGAESASVNASPFPVVPQTCTPNLTVSDKDVLEVNGTANTGITSCSGGAVNADIIAKQFGLIKSGDLLTFKINICNSGNADAYIKSVTDTFTNLIKPSGGWNARYIDGSTGPAGVDINSTITETKNGDGVVTGITFNFNPNRVVVQKTTVGGVDYYGVGSITFKAQVFALGGVGSGLYRFQNRAVIVRDNDSAVTVSTPLFLFSTGAVGPDLKEVAP